MQTTGLSTTPILDRSDDNRSRKGRLKQMKRGPGVFVYEGGHKSVEFTPTHKTRARLEPLIDADGAPVVDDQGRPVLKEVGRELLKDHNQLPMLGGKPRRKIIEHETFSLPGWTPEGEEPQVFEQNVPQRVTHAPLALKLRCLGACRELEGEELEAWLATEAGEKSEAPKAKRGRKSKVDVVDGAGES